MRIAILHDEVPAGAAPDVADALVQARHVATVLRRLGHAPTAVPVTLDLPALQQTLADLRPDLAFNLVEAPAGQGRLIHLLPSWLDALGLPYTGSPAEAIFLTSHKLLAKRQMVAEGLPTPPCAGAGAPARGVFIIKSVWEHASIGLTRASVVEVRGAAELARAMRAAERRLGRECFAEAFVAGREFNLSLLADAAGPEVLPPAEMVFGGYAADEPHVVDYAEKWGDAARATRRFRFPRRDAPLLGHLCELARRCWECFGLRGYARVDFRVDEAGEPWVLEVNTNPCLAPDAGFAAAVKRAGLTMGQAVERILADT